MATILDVAREAGVGVGTVSRVLNDHPRVAPATRQRVEQAIERLGYRPNPLARGLSVGRSSTIAILVPSMTSGSVVARMRGAIDVFNAQDRPVSVVNIATADQRDRVLDDLLSRSRPAGLLVVSMVLSAEVRAKLEALGIALVLVDVDADGIDSFTIDDVEGGRMATEHLLGLGHRRIAFLGDAPDEALGFKSSRLRERGYREALAAESIEIDEALVRSGPFGLEAAHSLTRDLFGLPVPPTAVFASSDTQALGVLDAVRGLGMRVPRDVSVIGFDDLDIAPYVGLTTVRQPLEESGRRGAQRMLELVSGETPDPEHLVMELQLMERKTTGPVRVTA